MLTCERCGQNFYFYSLTTWRIRDRSADLHPLTHGQRRLPSERLPTWESRKSRKTPVRASFSSENGAKVKLSWCNSSVWDQTLRKDHELTFNRSRTHCHQKTCKANTREALDARRERATELELGCGRRGRPAEEAVFSAHTGHRARLLRSPAWRQLAARSLFLLRRVRHRDISFIQTGAGPELRSGPRSVGFCRLLQRVNTHQWRTLKKKRKREENVREILQTAAWGDEENETMKSFLFSISLRS